MYATCPTICAYTMIHACCECEWTVQQNICHAFQSRSHQIASTHRHSHLLSVVCSVWQRHDSNNLNRDWWDKALSILRLEASKRGGIHVVMPKNKKRSHIFEEGLKKKGVFNFSGTEFSGHFSGSRFKTFWTVMIISLKIPSLKVWRNKIPK